MDNAKISIKDLNLYYGDFHALKNVSMKLPEKKDYGIYRSQRLRKVNTF